MKKPIYPKLASVMAYNGDTISDLARLLKLSIPAISNRLTGKTEWTIGEIDTICRHYDKCFDELFTK